MRCRTAALILAASIAATGTASAQSPDDNWVQCKDLRSHPDMVIGACTAIIQSRQEVTAALSTAFHSRGNAYAIKRQYARAIRDYDHAIRLDPKLAQAFYDRG